MTLHGARNPVSGQLVLEATQWCMTKRTVLFRKSVTLAFASTSHRGSTAFSFLPHEEDVPVTNLFSLSSKSPLLCSAAWFCSWGLWTHLLLRAMPGSAKRRHWRAPQEGGSSSWPEVPASWSCVTVTVLPETPHGSLSCDFACTMGFLFTSSCFLEA